MTGLMGGLSYGEHGFIQEDSKTHEHEQRYSAVHGERRAGESYDKTNVQ